jgi:hypothetical protein
VLVSAVPPLMLKTESNPEGLPIEVFDGFRNGVTDNRAQFYVHVAAGPFYGFSRDGTKVYQEARDSGGVGCTFNCRPTAKTSGGQSGPISDHACRRKLSGSDQLALNRLHHGRDGLAEIEARRPRRSCSTSACPTASRSYVSCAGAATKRRSWCCQAAATRWPR